MARRLYKPMLATVPLKGIKLVHPEWSFELKFDGYRMLAYCDGGTVQLISRRGADYTDRFAEISQTLPRALRAHQWVVDGEVVAQDEKGLHTLSNLRRRKGRLMYYLFDILELRGKSLLRVPLHRRRELLKRIYRPNDRIFLSTSFEDAQGLLGVVKHLGLEGIIAKRVDSLYRPGKRSSAWIKLKIR